MVVCVHLLQDTERTIIPYLNKEETLEGLLNDEYDLQLTLKPCYYELNEEEVETKILYSALPSSFS